MLQGFPCIYSNSQSIDTQISTAIRKLDSIEAKKQKALNEIEEFKLKKIKVDLEKIGLLTILSGDELVKHEAMYLESEKRMRFYNED